MLTAPPNRHPPHPQKSADGRPPVAPQNLRGPTTTRSPKQKSRRMAAPRRSDDGTCEKPPTDVASVPRPLISTQHRKEVAPLRHCHHHRRR